VAPRSVLDVCEYSDVLTNNSRLDERERAQADRNLLTVPQMSDSQEYYLTSSDGFLTTHVDN
jgi:hypothetical protein